MEIAEHDIFEVIGSQRAMRRFKPDPVPDELVKKMIWAATRAPNGGNVQPWRFVVVTDPAKKRGLRDIYLAEWTKYRAAREAAPGPAMTEEMARSMARSVARGTHLAEHLDEVPVLIIPCGFLLAVNTGIASGSSIYPAVQNLMLAARALGLGTVLTTLHRHNEGAVRELLGIPEEAHTAALIPVGWPVGKFGAGPRLPVEAVTYWDDWGAKRP
jgi:nitroreductase